MTKQVAVSRHLSSSYATQLLIGLVDLAAFPLGCRTLVGESISESIPRLVIKRKLVDDTMSSPFSGWLPTSPPEPPVYWTPTRTASVLLTSSESVTATPRTRGANFTSTEDVAVGRAWVRVSEHPVKRAEQRSFRFYERTCEFYHTFKSLSCEERTMESIRARSKLIKQRVLEFWLLCCLCTKTQTYRGFRR